MSEAEESDSASESEEDSNPTFYDAIDDAAPGDAENFADQQFDISLPATHSYLSPDMVEVKGRSLKKAGWTGPLPCIGHRSVLFPGETVPMMLSHTVDNDTLSSAIANDGFFGLIFPVNANARELSSGYGVLCEVYETTVPDVSVSRTLSFKAKARQRFRYKNMPNQRQSGDIPVLGYNRLTTIDIIILPEILPTNLLFNSRLAGLDRLRSTKQENIMQKIRRMDAMMTNWPLPIIASCDPRHLADIIQAYFCSLKYETLPSDVATLSFWAASNLPLSYVDRLCIFKENNAIQRLWIEANFVDKYYILYCNGCGELTKTEIAREENVFSMSTEGIKSNFCNPDGYVHDVMTVKRVSNVKTSGMPSNEFSWFPGYSWTIMVCRYCGSHIGWRFGALANLTPRTFYAICRNYVFRYSPIKGCGLKQ